MICRQTQNMIDFLLSLKTREDIAVDTINKIASTYEESTSTNNKIASTNKTKKIGELVEFQSLLCSLK